MPPDDEWAFADPPNVATITMRQIIDEGQPILLVTHDDDDGCWTFLTGGDVVEADARVIGLREMVRREPSLKELADLPLGWRAWRKRVGDPWKRAPDVDRD